MDNFALPGVQTLSRALTPFVLSANLTKLPPYLPTVINWFIIFTLVEVIVSPIFSSLVSTTYPTLKRKQKWHMHVVSQVHALTVVPLAVRYFSLEALEKDKLHGWDDRVGTLQAIAVAYFLWDTLNELILADNLGFILHGLACFSIYTAAFSPFLSYFTARCLLWETSTFFLNNHWFLDKTKQTGSTCQLINGIFLIASFFCVRIVHGLWTSYNFWIAMLSAEQPFVYYVIYCVGNVVLNGLNLLWFGKMIDSLQRRFKTPQKKRE
ncbi:DUF887-domain-containing protein [Marasmius fiardii PR-910]|nr:DUF887-domain-containing protein [Marasmius fiardii PR-910]